MEKQIISTNNAPAAIGPYSQGVIVRDTVYTSGQLPINPQTGEIAETIEEQTRQALENGKAIIEAAGSDMSKVFKTTVFLKDLKDFAKMNEVYATYFSEKHPARSTVGGAELAKGALVEIELVATI
ncbi:RidA family protein [Clostridium aciditolerans]|jgi:2-iminobutanoate/2-iminopropanoate deaminase|uniref:RidA family protein n=1 Tax=Clostridium aciditolerans TaxID=339861 RepID=A0A934HW88_9CLOT|nr:RidA family protein [Clostridium aciditolerans]MBI6871958.1 RidA family protein [Clostridium aciditolerans]